MRGAAETTPIYYPRAPLSSYPIQWLVWLVSRSRIGKVAELISKTLETQPEGSTHWSTRTMASEIGVSHMTVCRVWRTFGFKPHLRDTFKLSTDPFFVEKVRDIVGLYLYPPENALVLCVDEKGQCQALERNGYRKYKATFSPRRYHRPPPPAAAARAPHQRLPQPAAVAGESGAQLAVARQSAVWTGRAGCGRVKAQGFPGARASMNPRWRGRRRRRIALGRGRPGRWEGGTEASLRWRKIRVITASCVLAQ